MHKLEIGAWFAFFVSALDHNMTLLAGLASLCLSFTGIVLNLIKIYKEKK